MPTTDRYSDHSLITLAKHEEFTAYGRHVDAVTVPYSRDLSAQVTLHGRIPGLERFDARADDKRVDPFEAVHAAEGATSPAAAEAIRTEIGHGANVAARQVVAPSEALSQVQSQAAARTTTAALIAKPLVQ